MIYKWSARPTIILLAFCGLYGSNAIGVVATNNACATNQGNSTTDEPQYTMCCYVGNDTTDPGGFACSNGEYTNPRGGAPTAYNPCEYWALLAQPNGQPDIEKVRNWCLGFKSNQEQPDQVVLPGYIVDADCSMKGDSGGTCPSEVPNKQKCFPPQACIWDNVNQTCLTAGGENTPDVDLSVPDGPVVTGIGTCPD